MSDDVTFVEFMGEKFAAPQRINQRLVIRFQALAAQGADTTDIDPQKAGEAAVLLDKLVTNCVRAEDRERFEELCDTACPTDEELMGYVVDVLSAVAGRPTGRSSVSSDGPTSTQPKSEGDSSSVVIRRLETAGRPDLALMVTMADEARSAV